MNLFSKFFFVVVTLVFVLSHPSLTYATIEINPNKWEITYQDSRIKIYSQKIKGFDVIAFKTNAFIEQDVLSLITVLRDAKGSEKWSENLKYIEYINEINDLEAIVYEIRNFPWPLHDRDLVLQYKAALNKEHKSILVNFHSITHDKFPEQKDLVRAKLYYGAMEFWPKKGGTDIELTILASPKGSIPNWLVNIFQEKVPYQFVVALEEQSRKSKRTPLPGIKKLIEDYYQLYPQE